MRTKKKLALPLLAALTLLALLLLTACVSPMYTVTLAGGDNADFQTQTQLVAENSEFTLPSMDEPWEGHVFTGWKNGDAVYAAGNKVKVTSDMTFTAMWEDEIKSYAVTFIYGLNGEKSQTLTLQEGTMPTAPEVPDEISPDNSVNRIAGWKPAIVAVSADATYTALYEKAEITAKFMDGDTVLKEQKLKSGETPVAPAVSDKDFAPSHTMVFTGWDKEIGAIVSDTVYMAQFEQRMTSYEITFVYGSTGEHSEKVTLEYGQTPTAPTVEDETFAPSHTMVFTGWDTEISSVTGAATYTAQYDKRMMSYEITFVYGLAGEQQSKVTTEYGKKPAAPEIGNITAEDGTEHRFAGWEPVVTTVTGTATYTAKYAREGAIATFKDGDDVLTTQIVKLGEAPTPPSVENKVFHPSHTMVFMGWDKKVGTIFEDTVYTAVFEKRMMSYEITFVYGSNGEHTEKFTLDYGATPAAPDVQDEDFAPSHTMVFTGWDTDISTVTSNATYTAQYKKQITQYQITFVYGSAGEHSEKVTLDYGAAILAPDVQDELFAPSHTMVFTGWDQEFSTVTGDATFTAQYEKRMMSYLVTFVYGIDGEYSDEFTLEYGQMPTPPHVSDVIMSNTLVKVFDGWDKTVASVSGTATYMAKYRDTAREYTLRFADSAFVKFYDETGANQIASLTGTYGQEMRFTVKKNAGAYILDMKLLLGETTLTATNGVYSATLTADGLTVREQGARWVRFDVDVTAENVAYLPFATQGLEYGTILKVYAKGNEWYEDSAPSLTYGGVLVASDGKETKDGVEYFTYNVFIDKNASIEIEGILDVVPVTYIDILGKEHTIDWTIGIHTIGFSTKLNGYNPTKEILSYQGLAYKCSDKEEPNGIYYVFLYTESADLKERILSENDYNEKLAALAAAGPVLPEKGGVNKYYVVYFQTNAVTQTTVGFTLPYQATNVKYFSIQPEGYTDSYDNGWKNMYYKGTGVDNTAPHYIPGNGTETSITRRNFANGTIIYLRYDLPAGMEMPVLYDMETGEETLPQEHTVNGESVFCYKFIKGIKASCYAAKFENTHTISFNLNEGIPEQYTITDLYGIDPQFEGINVQHNGIYLFKIVYNGYTSDITTKYGSVSKTFIEGFLPYTFTGVADFTYTITSQSSSSCSVVVTVSNITSNIAVSVNYGVRASSDMAFTISDDYEIVIDGTPLEGSTGETVLAKITYASIIELRVKDGYRFEDTYIKFYYYLLGKTSPQQLLGVTSFSDNYKSWYIKMLPRKFSNTYDIAKPSYFTGINILPDFVNAEQDLSRTEATEANGVYFSDGEPTWANKGGAFTFSVSVPYGKVPKLYIQYSDTLSDGFLPYGYELVKEEGANNLYTFTVSPVGCDILWYIKLEADVFDITFLYGENQTTLQLPYGADLSKISLPKEFEGMNDGVPGFFRILGWSSTEGGQEDTILAEKNGTLWAVTEFTAAAAVFDGVYYLDLNDAFAALNENSKGTLDLVYSQTGAPALQAGDYNLPAGVTMRLPYALDAYGRKHGETTDKPSMFYADATRGRVALILGAGVTLNVYGTLSVGGIVGYPASGQPYQGQTSADYAILQLDGAINVQKGGVLEVNGYVVGNGKVEILVGGASRLPFIVKDYKGGTNSSNVYDAGYVPLNIYEMPNIQTNYKINYGANEYAYAMLVALGGYNEAEVCAIGAEGMIRPASGGYVEKKTTRIENPRYSDATKKYEPPFEFRTTLDLYGGATDGTLTLMSFISTEGMLMAIPYTYSAITLHDGEYAIYNMFKIMPGAKVVVDGGASLTVKNEKAGEKTYLAGLIVYEDTFVEDHGTCKTFQNSQQLLYPSQPNGKAEGGALIVNGTLILEGRFGGDVLSEAADAQIKVLSETVHLTFTAKEAIQPSGLNEPLITYEQTSSATVNGGATVLERGKIYRSYQNEDGSFGWKS